MLPHHEIGSRLAAGAAAAFLTDGTGLAEAQSWLESLSARELLRVDGVARSFDPGPSLGRAQQWSRDVLDASTASAAIASMHGDGRVREQALRRLAHSKAPLTDRMIALRAGDHVGSIRELAISTLNDRTSADQAARIMSVLHRFEQRYRGSDAGRAYLEQLVATHGEARTWAMLRDATDRDLRRFGYEQSIRSSLIDLPDATAQLPRERDQVVRRRLVRLIAEQAEPQTIRELLLRSRLAEGRVLGLVRLEAADLTMDDVLPLLADPGVLVRFWARKRWAELGGKPEETYRQLIGTLPHGSQQAFAYVGFTEAGGRLDRAEILGLVREPTTSLQRVGLRLLVAAVTPSEIPEVFVLVRSSSAGVARLAVEVLKSNPGLWSLADLAGLKADSEPKVRRRAWLLHRSRGGWETVLADLEILRDPDEDLARFGRQPRSPMYSSPTDGQRARLERLLVDAPLGRDQRLVIAFAAGLDGLTATFRAEPRRVPPPAGSADEDS